MLWEYVCLVVGTLARPLPQCTPTLMHVCVCVFVRQLSAAQKLVPAMKQLLGQLITSPWRNSVSLSTSSSISLSLHLDTFHSGSLSVHLEPTSHCQSISFPNLSSPYSVSFISLHHHSNKTQHYLGPSSHIEHRTHRKCARRMG